MFSILILKLLQGQGDFTIFNDRYETSLINLLPLHYFRVEIMDKTDITKNKPRE